MIVLLLFLGCAVAAGIIVAGLRQREGREPFKGQTFVRRTAGATFGVLGVALIIGVLVAAGTIIWIVSNLLGSFSGCVNC